MRAMDVKLFALDVVWHSALFIAPTVMKNAGCGWIRGLILHLAVGITRKNSLAK